MLLIGLVMMMNVMMGQDGKVDLKIPKYEIKETGKMVWMIPLFVGGFFDGAVRGFEFDNRNSFHRKGWTDDKEGFFGREGWRRAYVRGDPMLGYKSIFTDVYGAPDAPHVMEDLGKLGLVGGSMGLVLAGERCGQKWYWYLLDFAGALMVSALGERLGVYWIRH